MASSKKKWTAIDLVIALVMGGVLLVGPVLYVTADAETQKLCDMVAVYSAAGVNMLSSLVCMIEAYFHTNHRNRSLWLALVLLLSGVGALRLFELWPAVVGLLYSLFVVRGDEEEGDTQPGVPEA